MWNLESKDEVVRIFSFLFCSIIGNGCVVHLDTLFRELSQLEENGVDYSNRLFISDRAHVVLDIHQQMDSAQEMELGAKKIGTTGKGIGPAYREKVNRSGIRIGDLLDMELFTSKFEKITASFLGEHFANLKEDEFEKYDTKTN